MVRSDLDPIAAARDIPPAATRRRPRYYGLALLLVLTPATFAQVDLEEPLLPQAISETDVEMRGRYARQWKQDGDLIVMFTGGFRLDMGPRRLSANTGVVWITPQRTDEENRKYYELTVYLAEQARVEEFGGTVIEDRVLLVSNLRTYGHIIKYHDAHSPESGAQSPLYQQAVHDRELIEAGLPLTPEIAKPVAVVRPVQTEAIRADRVPRAIRYHLPNVEPVETPGETPMFISRRDAERRVYFARDGGPDAPMLEILADNAVVFAGERFSRNLLGDDLEGTARPGPETNQPATPGETPPPRDSGASPFQGIAQGVRAVYLEGDVVLTLGTSFVRASRLYYDFERDRALILDAVFRADIPDRNIPLYIRADEIRQHSAREFSARNARVSTSEFYTPHYHVGADRVVLRDLTQRDIAGRAAGAPTGEYELYNTTVNINNAPILWWPYSTGRLEASETGLRRLRTGYSGDFGTELETSWHLFNLLGIRQPVGYDTTWHLDYFSKRGPATGVDVDYERQNHFGLFRSYYIHDDGVDNLGPLRRYAEEPETDDRGRVLWRHRHYLPGNWEATFEISYLSDPNFLEEYERSEFNEGKEQETLIYLKRAGEVDAITFLANWRLLDFTTQTEHLPELAYRRIGDTFLSPLVMYHESRIGGVRYRPDGPDSIGYPLYLYQHRYTGDAFSDRNRSTDVTFRTDARQEFELPLKLGPVNLVPFASFRGTYWDGSPLLDGGLWRGLGVYGMRGSTVFSRVYDEINSELFDIHRLRHIIQPEFVAWWSHANTRSELLNPFDYGIETIDDFYGAMIALRQTWQTKRGGTEHPRTVDLLTLNFEAGVFGDADGRVEDSNGWVNPLRPENSRSRNYLAGEAIWRISDTTSLLYEFNVDTDDWSFDRHNVSLAVERSPRLAYVFGYRHASDINMDLIGGGWNYKLSEKHITTVRSWFDLDRGDLGEVSVAYVRKLPRWYVAVSCEYDSIDDDVTISLSVWPEGIPEWTIGTRRFTGLGTTTGIRP
ncbi:MAG: LPS assembly protein LptD [Planctomycetota bacterium]